MIHGHRIGHGGVVQFGEVSHSDSVAQSQWILRCSSEVKPSWFHSGGCKHFVWHCSTVVSAFINNRHPSFLPEKVLCRSQNGIHASVELVLIIEIMTDFRASEFGKWSSEFHHQESILHCAFHSHSASIFAVLLNSLMDNEARKETEDLGKLKRNKQHPS